MKRALDRLVVKNIVLQHVGPDRRIHYRVNEELLDEARREIEGLHQ